MTNIDLIGERIGATILSLIRTPGGPHGIPPHAMENMLMILDIIRLEISNLTAHEPAPLNSYAQYLYENGFGTFKASTHYLNQRELSDDEVEALRKLNDLWQDYLRHSRRLGNP